jgi:hypothetical protein
LHDVGALEADAIGEPGFLAALTRESQHVVRKIDPVYPSAICLRDQERRPAQPAADVEDSHARAQIC